MTGGVPAHPARGIVYVFMLGNHKLYLTCSQ